MRSTNEYLIAQTIIVIVLTAIQLYYYWRTVRYLRSTGKPSWLRRAAMVPLVVFTVPMIAMLIFSIRVAHLPSWLVTLYIYPLYVWHFSSVFVILILFAGMLVRAPVIAAKWILRSMRKSTQPVLTKEEPRAGGFDPRRRTFIRQGVTVLAGVTVTGSAIGAIRRNSYEIVHQEIRMPGLPPELTGFTIALISDIHSSPFMTKDQMEEYAAAVNGLGADLIAVTGDFVNSNLEEVYPFSKAFSSLKAPLGVYGVLGNHDYYTRQVEAVAKEVNDCGIRLLRNGRETIARNGTSIDLIGIDDVGTAGHAAQLIDRALAGSKGRSPRILLCHRPYFFDQAVRRKIGLTLSGHTHGGQVVFARFGGDVIAPARMVSPYVAGLYKIGDANLYVSRGVGTVGVPIRINCPPEVTRITLLPAANHPEIRRNRPER